MQDLILITGCSDPLMWYAGSVGQVAPLVRDLPSERAWLSREPSGLLNIVKHTDAARVPAGYGMARPGTVLQQLDLVFIDGRWRSPGLEELGKPVDGLLVVRKEST